MIRFEIPFAIAPKQADRSQLRYRGTGKSRQPYIHHHQSDKVLTNANNVAALVAPHRPDIPLEGPLCMELRFLSPFPKSARARDRKRGWAWHWTKPDLTNLVKQLEDVLEQAGFFRNDSQIARRVVQKQRHTGAPLVEVRLWQLRYKDDGGKD